jgi:solute carrier family 25 (mitochondrial carnitine/acylcarnitine transporter), member 20/29
MFLAGVLGGLASFAVSAPTELLKVRAQAAASPASPAASPPRTPTTAMEAGTGPGAGGTGRARGRGAAADPGSTWSQARALLRAEGPRGFFLGGGVTAARDAIGYGFYFVAYEAMRRELFGAAATPADRNHGPVEAPGGGAPVPELAAWKVLACGGVAGVLSWAVVFPLDVVKTRVQAQPVLEVPLPAQAAAAATAAATATRAGAVAVVGEHAPLLLHPDRAKALVTAAVQRVRPASSSSSSSLRSVPSSASTSPSSLSFPASARATTVPARQSTWAVTAAAYREGGLGVFFRGLGVCSVRAFVVNAVQWAVYEWIVALLVRTDATTKR